jgi:predicted enzyme related to lactoylglutathione lyase
MIDELARGHRGMFLISADFGFAGVVAGAGRGDKARPWGRASLALGRVLLYARNVENTVNFYERHFGFSVLRLPGDRIVELVAANGGANLMVHPVGKGVRVGQVTVKLVFDVEDVPAFCEKCAGDGLLFGPVHGADGYTYANAKDPCGNNISVSSRAFRKA